MLDASELTGFQPMHSNWDAIWYKLSLLGFKQAQVNTTTTVNGENLYTVSNGCEKGASWVTSQIHTHRKGGQPNQQDHQLIKANHFSEREVAIRY